MDDIILNIEGLGKSFFGVPAIRNVSLPIKKGHLTGLIGENGAGKSTLMNLIGGVLQPDSGTFTLNGQPFMPCNPHDATDAGIKFIHQELNLFSNLSIAENIFVDNFPRIGRTPFVDREKIRKRTADLLRSVGLNMSPSTLVEKLSPGERQLVEIAKALSTPAQIIIFDEPTTSLTARETDRLFELIKQLRSDGQTIIYISHILADVLALADNISVLRDGELVGTGPKEEFTLNRMIAMMVGRDIDQLYPDHQPSMTNAVSLEAKGVSQSGIVENINLVLHRGEILGIFGLMGSGRSELARIIFGIDDYERGEIFLNGQKIDQKSPRRSIQGHMAFVTENRREEGLLMDLPISENLALVSLPMFGRGGQWLDSKAMLGATKTIADDLHIRSGGAIERQPVKSLSGGNQQKTVIGKWLVKKPLVLILDEPTRGVDVGAKYEIYTITSDLAAQGTGILVISSELEELIGICDRIVVMSNGEIKAEFQRHEFESEQILRAAFLFGSVARTDGAK